MPFKKTGTDDYTGPSGKHFNLNQVRLYYANGGKFPAHAEGGTVKPQERPMARAKSYGTFNAGYAAGGPVLGRARDFIKSPDAFRTDKGDPQDYSNKKGEKGKDKSMKPVKPRC